MEAGFAPASPDTSCSSFLLGGNYYPGKDKKKSPVVCGRYRTTWWHRLCCASTPRLLCTGALLLMGMVTVLQSSPSSPSSGSSSSLRRPTHVKLEGRKTSLEDDDADGILGLDGKPLGWKGPKPLTPIGELRESAYEVHKKLEHLMWGKDLTNVHRPHNERWRALEKIAPKWVRRNDVEDDEGEQGPEEKKDKASVAHKEPAAHEPGNAAKDRRRQLRTLGSEQVIGMSKCPSDLSELTTTLVIQSTVDRIWLLEETCRRWTDPIVLVIYISQDDNYSGSKSLEQSCPQLTIVQHIATAEEEAKSSNYPVNVLRNEGLDTVKTSHILVVDVDFVPSADLHKIIRKTLDARDTPDNHAIVVPAFERRTHGKECKTPEECQSFLKKDSEFIPRNIASLRTCVRDKDCIVFQSDNNWEGHYTTHSNKWLEGDWYDDKDAMGHDLAVDYTRPIKSITCLDSLRYEPYVVIRWCPSSSSAASTPVAPYYDERFHGYGKNKIQQIAHLRFRKYQFYILPRGFIVHHPHPTSKAKESWNDVQNDPLHRKMDNLYPKYLTELSRKYGDDNIVPPCQKLLDRMKKAKKTKTRAKQ